MDQRAPSVLVGTILSTEERPQPFSKPLYAVVEPLVTGRVHQRADVSPKNPGNRHAHLAQYSHLR